MESDGKAYQLVLSVFRGLNFVVKKPGVKCKLISKLHESILESKVYNLSTKNSDPDFNHQVAWKLTKKQIQDLRLNRGVVKIECHQLDKDEKIESLIGYCTISVKDAIKISTYEEIDLKNAVTIPLKGTRSPWLQYGPKLQLLLHFEDPDKPVAPTSTRKMVLSKNPTKKEDKKAPFPPPPSADVPTSFQWEMNEEMGYFQLGKPGPDDDLYIMNIVLVCVRSLDELLSQRSPPKDLPWRIEFEAFGMTIDSDPFTLQFSDEGKPTYLGEKSTARIRASEEEFTRYLKQSALEFKVQTALGTKPETVGCAWVDLAPLASKDVFEIRAAIEIVSKQGKFISRDNRPQLCYIVDVQRSPRFFSKNYVKLEDIRCPGQNFERSREDLTSLEKEMKSFTIQERIPERKAEVVVEADMKKEKILAPAEVGGGDKVEVDRKSGAEPPKEADTAVFKEPKRPVQVDIANHTAMTDDSAIAGSIPSTFHGERSSSKKTKTKFPNAVDRLTSVCTPGNYCLTLKFTGFEVRAKAELKDNWVLSFWHPPLGVSKEDRCKLVAKPQSTSTGNRIKFDFDEDEHEVWEFLIPKISTEILETPLKVYFFREGQKLDSEPIAFSHIPLGDIFIAEPGPSGRKLTGSVGMYVVKPQSDQPVKIGYLGYDFTLEEADEHSANVVLASPSVTLATPSHFGDRLRFIEPESPVSFRTRDKDIEDWKTQEEKLFRQKLQEKERAYFQMLSMEHKKQKEESEKAVRTKMKELDEMKKELSEKLKEIAEKEEMLKLRESQISEANRADLYELTKERDDLKLMCRRLEADKKIEIESLSKRLDDALSNLEVSNSKIRSLERKLEAKEARISELIAEKTKFPEQEAIRKIDLLEQKIQQLQRDLKKALQEKDHYRSQSQQIARALQHKSEESREQLREENENLKLQMLAARQQELLNQELKQVATLSNEIKAARDVLGREGQFPSSARGREREPLARDVSHRQKGDNTDSSSKLTSSSFQERNALLEAEIERLTRSREGLLKTQAYTIYDPLITEIEDEILRNLQRRAELLAENST